RAHHALGGPGAGDDPPLRLRERRLRLSAGPVAHARRQRARRDVDGRAVRRRLAAGRHADGLRDDARQRHLQFSVRAVVRRLPDGQRHEPRPLRQAAAMTAALALVAMFGLQAPGRVISDVRVHGNRSTPDAVVLEIAGINVGDTATPETPGLVETRLRRSGRFNDVEVLARSRTLDGSDMALGIIVREEYVLPIDAPGGGVARVARKIGNTPLFLPILDFGDYGFSYGLRASFVDVTGQGSRVSVPFTWGGEKRAA